MTVLSFDEEGVDVVYEGTEFRLEKALIEEATGKSFPDVTDQEDRPISIEIRRIREILIEGRVVYVRRETS